MPDPYSIYVAARKALLDALSALADHADSIVLVGAQAVYVHTGHYELPVEPFTMDADIALNPESIATTPDIISAMEGAHFVLGGRGNPGEWVIASTVDGKSVNIPVDILVPESLAPQAGKRSARLQGHGKMAARKVEGLESTIVDNAWTEIRPLDAIDGRLLECRVAGPASLLIAKAYKLRDRLEPGSNPDRRKDKDALDVYRIAASIPFARLEADLQRLLADERSSTSAKQGTAIFVQLFGVRRAPGVGGTAIYTRAGNIP